jgi:hypothetical protein
LRGDLYTYFEGVNDRYFFLLFELSLLFVFNVGFVDLSSDLPLNILPDLPLDISLEVPLDALLYVPLDALLYVPLYLFLDLPLDMALSLLLLDVY